MKITLRQQHPLWKISFSVYQKPKSGVNLLGYVTLFQISRKGIPLSWPHWFVWVSSKQMEALEHRQQIQFNKRRIASPKNLFSVINMKFQGTQELQRDRSANHLFEKRQLRWFRLKNRIQKHGNTKNEGKTSLY